MFSHACTFLFFNRYGTTITPVSKEVHGKNEISSASSSSKALSAITQLKNVNFLWREQVLPTVEKPYCARAGPGYFNWAYYTGMHAYL